MKTVLPPLDISYVKGQKFIDLPNFNKFLVLGILVNILINIPSSLGCFYFMVDRENQSPWLVQLLT